MKTKETGRTCGNCLLTDEPSALSGGLDRNNLLCFGAPPSSFPVQGAGGVGVVTIRPAVTRDTPACGAWKWDGAGQEPRPVGLLT